MSCSSRLSLRWEISHISEAWKHQHVESPVTVFISFQTLTRPIFAVTNTRVTAELFTEGYEMKGSGTSSFRNQNDHSNTVKNSSVSVLGCGSVRVWKHSAMIHWQSRWCKSVLFCLRIRAGRMSLLHDWTQPHIYCVIHGSLCGWAFSHCGVNWSLVFLYFPDPLS